MCYINVQDWVGPRDKKLMVVVSNNTEEMIRNSTSELKFVRAGIAEQCLTTAPS